MNQSILLLIKSCFLLCLTANMVAQELPPVSKYSTGDYGADNQNWSITQTAEKNIFFANSKGLLKFDGEKWELKDSPNKTILRSVFALENKVYSGAYMDFGVWTKDSLGDYQYQSLSNDLDLLEDEQFWKIDQLEHYIVFQSLNSIYLYNTLDNKFDIITSNFGISKMVVIDNILYYHKINKGIFKQVNGEEVAVNTSEIFKNSLLINLYKINNELYAQTQYNGIINLETNEEFIPDNFEEIWSKISIYSSIQLDNGEIYLGTISHGLLKLHNKQVEYQLTQENALTNNTVLNLFEDQNSNIWLGLDNGINCVNKSSSISIYNDDNGELGTVYCSVNFRDTIYLGTNQGLFYRDISEKKFKFIKGTKGQVWSLFKHDNILLCGHNVGTFQIEGNKAKLIKNLQGTWMFRAANDSTIISGNYNGLHILKRESNDSLTYVNKVKGFDISTKYFEFIDSTTILVNHEYKGVYKLTLNQNLTEVIDLKKDSSVPKGLYSSIIKYQDKILYAFKNGIFTYDESSSTFIKNAKLSSVYDPETYTSGRLVKTEDDRIWVFSQTDITLLIPSSVKNEFIIEHIPLNHGNREQISGYENVSLIYPDTYLLGNSNGYQLLNLKDFTQPKPEVFINSISVQNKWDEVISGLTNKHELKYKNNNLNFDVSSYNFEASFETEYQYKLENYTPNWSNWQKESEVSFKNLPHGDYVFKVRSRIGKNNISEVLTFSFTILKPFYLSNLMIAFYILVLIILGIVIHVFYKQYYKKQKRKLQEKANKELELKDLESKQKIMKINNEKLKQDIENKNKELAISTMSLIKKNEFLSGIKSDLKMVKTKDDKLDKVLKVINRNLNNSDDWKFFEEAFNNADKDFLKKIKSKHPSLTPNDLKLCAYLRLNLSSKEIAPLFNISTRSVEVKRYRLRKKMDLSRNDSLTNYILEL
ncbi:helix-turn-helix and ligand-binding sensor domain-containing protein [Psychroflexus aestuariivivens]|uniref:helix-turn-helix and ligand-binding sensor domain-containing protein n=1 Tax=Psychroflexus aestuariivivens TaxID=1795040 RepID=UPI000FDAF8DC|nr:triple tyrosine motif-containing protein [Psychroflexus aestuariivivens]